MSDSIIYRCHPSLALIKYWGKSDSVQNLPATSSVAVNLNSFYVETKATFSDSRDTVCINQNPVPEKRYEQFFDEARRLFKSDKYYRIESNSNFPTASGLASSSAGFAAMALACDKLHGQKFSDDKLSPLARIGSASAARSLFGGFVSLEADSERAKEIYPESYWPDLCIIICIVKKEAKKISSRQAMEHVRKTSPFYNEWIQNSKDIYLKALKAIEEKNLKSLGELMQQSYLRMFATIHSSYPPIFYWSSESIGLIKLCQDLRDEGVSAWETMDAGPQVKILCPKSEANKVIQSISHYYPEIETVESAIGAPPCPIDKFTLP